MTIEIPEFHSALLGFSKTEVLDFLAELETEKENGESRQAAADQTIATLRQENETLKKQLEALSVENDRLCADNQELRKKSGELRDRLTSMEEQGESIQNALISAQRMSRIVLTEAQEEADRVTIQAKNTATKTLEEAKKRNDTLQASYDRMLLDTGKMKAELIDLYRRHLALLAEIPGQAQVPVLEEEVLETVGE